MHLFLLLLRVILLLILLFLISSSGQPQGFQDPYLLDSSGWSPSSGSSCRRLFAGIILKAEFAQLLQHQGQLHHVFLGRVAAHSLG